MGDRICFLVARIFAEVLNSTSEITELINLDSMMFCISHSEKNMKTVVTSHKTQHRMFIDQMS